MVLPQTEEIELLCLGKAMLSHLQSGDRGTDLFGRAVSSGHPGADMSAESLWIQMSQLGAWQPCPSGRWVLREGPWTAPCSLLFPPKVGHGQGMGGLALWAVLAGYNAELSRGLEG